METNNQDAAKEPCAADSGAATDHPSSEIPSPRGKEGRQRLNTTRGDHCLNIFVSFELKERLATLARKYDRTTAEVVRAILRIGLPMMEGVNEAEELVVREYMDLFRRLRRARTRKK